MSFLRFMSVASIVGLGVLGTAPAGMAWSSGGHRLVTAAAVESLDSLALPLSSSAMTAIVGASVQPDLMRARELPALRAIEAPRHFLDLEILQGSPLPETRWEYLGLLTRIAETGDGLLRPGGDISQVGTLPYAIVEGTQRLAAIFAQLRVRPDSPDLQAMAAHQAGFVAHYAQDLCQPLHTTVHHNGRAMEDGSSPHTGIHGRVDGLIHSIPVHRETAERRRPQVLDPLFPAVLAALHESHSQVDRVYELTDKMAQLESGGEADPDLAEFANERFQLAVDFTADLIRTAWHLSASVELDGWAVQSSGQAPQ